MSNDKNKNEEIKYKSAIDLAKELNSEEVVKEHDEENFVRMQNEKYGSLKFNEDF